MAFHPHNHHPAKKALAKAVHLQALEIRRLRTELHHLRDQFAGEPDAGVREVLSWQALNSSLNSLVNELHANTECMEKLAGLVDRQDAEGAN